MNLVRLAVRHLKRRFVDWLLEDDSDGLTAPPAVSRRPAPSAIVEELIDPETPFLGTAAASMLAQPVYEHEAGPAPQEEASPNGSLEERRARLRLR